MEILNGFPLLPERVSVVLSSLTWLRQKDMEHPSVSWLTHWQLCLGMKGDPLQAEILTLSDNVVLLGLVMTRKKQLEVLSFLENIGVRKVYLASDDYQQLKKWLYKEKGSERQAKMLFPLPAGKSLCSRPKTLVVGFDQRDFPEEVKDLKQVCFIWRSRTYSFNGCLPGIEEAFLSSQIGRAGIHEIKRTLAQAGIPELSVSYHNNCKEVADFLCQSYAGFVTKPKLPPMPKTKVVVIGADSSDLGRYQKAPDLLWWPADNDKWDELPNDACLFLVSSGLLRFDRLSLSDLATRRGVKFQPFGKENLDEFLRERAQLAQQASAPAEVIEAVSRETVLESVGKKGVSEMPKKKGGPRTQTDVIREHLDVKNVDELLPFVVAEFPSAQRQNVATMWYQQLKKRDKVGSMAKRLGASNPDAHQVDPPPALGTLADLFRQLHKTIDAIEAALTAMEARLDRLAPFEEALSKIQAK